MIFVEGLSRPEGPVVLPDGSWCVVEMGPERGCITQVAADGGRKRMIARTGRPNGLALDADGGLWVAESLSPSLLRVTMDGAIERILDSCGGKLFLFPNDLCFGPDGALYMTDSGIPAAEFAPGGIVRPDYKSLSYDGRVYRIDLNARSIAQLDGGLLFPNGIAFGPDDSLYVNETVTGMIYGYRVGGGPTAGTREDFSSVIDPSAPAGFAGPDGMAFDAEGNLYVTIAGHSQVAVVDPGGTIFRRITTAGPAPTNVAFGLPGDNRIYVTEYTAGTIEVFETVTGGLRLHVPTRRGLTKTDN